MLSDELDSKPEVSFPSSCTIFMTDAVDSVVTSRVSLSVFCCQLLVQFVQNASIPLVQGLEDSESKHYSCLPLLAAADSSLCSQLELTGQQLLTAPGSCRVHPRSNT